MCMSVCVYKDNNEDTGMLKSTPLDIFIISTRFILLHTDKSQFQLKHSQETADTVIISKLK